MCNNAKWGHGSHPLGIAFIFKNTILGSFGSVRQLCKHQKAHPRSLLRGTRHHPHTKSTSPPKHRGYRAPGNFPRQPDFQGHCQGAEITSVKVLCKLQSALQIAVVIQSPRGMLSAAEGCW